MPTIIATPKNGNANSYISLAVATEYFNNTLREASWTGYDDSDKQRALIEACAQIESLRLAGVKYDTSTPQALHFPRAGEVYGAAIEEAFTSDYDVAVSLTRAEIVSGSETVETSDGATEYTKDTDFTMQYPAGTVTVLSTGSMSDATAYQITFDYWAAPEEVEQAQCEQALWLLIRNTQPDLLDREALQEQGVTSISIDGHSESYSGRYQQLLCYRARWLLEPYIIRTARIESRGTSGMNIKPAVRAEPD